MPVQEENTVKVEYTGTLDDGTVFDSSDKHGQPLEFQVGVGQVIKGFDDAVMGMEVGDEKDIMLQPSEAYGETNPDMVQMIPRDQLPEGQEVNTGMMLMVSMPNGMKIPAQITEVTDESIVIDMNHPLAGKVLNFNIKVVEILS